MTTRTRRIKATTTTTPVEDVTVEQTTEELRKQIDQVDGDALSALLNDFWAARRVLVVASFPPRLTRYVRTIDLALARALDAGDMLNHARRADSDTERDTLIVNARPLTASSGRLQEEADQFLSSVVPIVVPQQ